MVGSLTLLALNFLMLGIVGYVCYLAGRTRGWNDNEESRAEDADRIRGIRGFDRPHPWTAATEARVHEADWRNKSEGFDL